MPKNPSAVQRPRIVRLWRFGQLLTGGSQWLGLAIMVLVSAIGIALVFAAPLAWVLGYLLSALPPR